MSDLSIPSALPVSISSRALRRPEIVDLDAAATAGRGAPATLKLPFDPLRVIDALVRRWKLMLAAGALAGAALFLAGWCRFETLHTAHARIIRQEPVSAFRQSETGETFKPREFTVPTFTALMYSGSLMEATSTRLAHRFAENVIRSGLLIVPERNTDLLSISMTSDQSPAAALEMLQSYVAETLQLARDLQSGDAAQMGRFLQQQIERTEADLVKANEELLEYGRKEQLLDADKQMDAWLGELGNFTLKYQSLKLDHETLDLRIQGVEKELAKVDTNASRVDAARRELAGLRVRYTDEHPTVIESREKLAALEEQIKASGPHLDAPPKPGESNVAESLYLDLVRLRSEKKVMSEQLQKLDLVRTELNQRLAELPRKAMAYARIKSRQQTLEMSRSLLAGRQREAALFEENAQGYFKLFSMDRVQDIATVPPTQKLAMVTGGGFASGFGLVALLTIVFTLLDRRIRSGGDLRRATGLPLIGMMPCNPAAFNESEAARAFRIWTRLQPLLLIPGQGGAMTCGVMHAGEDAAAGRISKLLAGAAVRRGLGCAVITRRKDDMTLPLDYALSYPECMCRVIQELPGQVCSLYVDESWRWTPEQQRRFWRAMECWQQLSNVVIFVELSAMEQPESVLIAEQLPNLLWAGASGGAQVQSVSDTLRLYRDVGCRLVAAVLDGAPLLRPQALARFALPLILAGGMSSLQAAEAPAPLLLGPGDAVNIAMPGFERHERREVSIGPDGRITYLQARDIVAAGLSVDQLRAKLTTELRRYYRSAKVVVTPFTFQSRKVYVLGKVVKKGAINLDRPLTVLEVLAEAGGLETGLYQQDTVELADLGRSFLMRGQQRMPVNLEALLVRGDMTQNIRVESGDYLYFPAASSNEIYVLGDVKTQGTQGLVANSSVHSAIALAGGFTQKAFTKRVLVIRGSLDRPERFVVDMDAILAARSQGFRLEPKDIVYIADRPWARAEELLNMAINAFLQGAVSSWTGARVGPFIRQPLLPRIR